MPDGVNSKWNCCAFNACVKHTGIIKAPSSPSLIHYRTSFTVSFSNHTDITCSWTGPKYIWVHYKIACSVLTSPGRGGEGAHKHFFHRDARPRTNFNSPRNRMALHSNPKNRITQKNRMTQDAMFVKVWMNMKIYYDFMFFSTVCSIFLKGRMPHPRAERKCETPMPRTEKSC